VDQAPRIANAPAEDGLSCPGDGVSTDLAIELARCLDPHALHSLRSSRRRGLINASKKKSLARYGFATGRNLSAPAAGALGYAF
jgi:hypothetical protein